MTRFIARICALLALVAGSHFLMDASSTGPGGGLFGAAYADEATDVDTSSIVEMAMGSEDAPVTIIEYASMTCGHCAAFHTETLPAIKEKYIETGKAKHLCQVGVVKLVEGSEESFPFFHPLFQCLFSWK